NRDPVPDALEVFKSDAATAAFRTGHDLLRGDVVDMAGKPLLLATAAAQLPLRRPRALRLQFGPQPAVTTAQAPDQRRGEDLAIGGDRQVGHAEIDAEETVRLLRFRSGRLHGKVQAEAALLRLVGQVRFAEGGPLQ